MLCFAHYKFSRYFCCYLIISTEQSQTHIDATMDFVSNCIRTHIDQQLSEEEARLEKERQRQVEQNRNTMKRLTDITLFLAKQGLAFRGHCEEPSSKGNFIATAELLSKHDEAMESRM